MFMWLFLSNKKKRSPKEKVSPGVRVALLWAPVVVLAEIVSDFVDQGGLGVACVSENHPGVVGCPLIRIIAVAPFDEG